MRRRIFRPDSDKCRGRPHDGSGKTADYMRQEREHRQNKMLHLEKLYVGLQSGD